MKLHTYFSSVEKARHFSKRTGIPASSLSDWAKGKRPIPLERMVLLEKATNGLVSRKDLKPDNWHLIWPELAQQDSKESV